MTVTTVGAQVALAIDLMQKYSSVYFALGQTDAWKNDDKPDAEDSKATEIPNVRNYIQVQDSTLCRPLQPDEAAPENPIVFNKTTYVRVSQKDAYSQNATCIYFSTKASLKDLTSEGTYSFRSTGVYIGLKPKDGVTKPVLSPSDVQDKGTLFSYGNGAQKVLDSETSIKLGAVYTLAPFEA